MSDQQTTILLDIKLLIRLDVWIVNFHLMQLQHMVVFWNRQVKNVHFLTSDSFLTVINTRLPNWLSSFRNVFISLPTAARLILMNLFLVYSTARKPAPPSNHMPLASPLRSSVCFPHPCGNTAKLDLINLRIKWIICSINLHSIYI